MIGPVIVAAAGDNNGDELSKVSVALWVTTGGQLESARLSECCRRSSNVRHRTQRAARV